MKRSYQREIIELWSENEKHLNSVTTKGNKKVPSEPNEKALAVDIQ